MKGKRHSEETKNKIGISAKRNGNEWQRGRKLSDETKRKMSLAKLDKPKINELIHKL